MQVHPTARVDEQLESEAIARPEVDDEIVLSVAVGPRSLATFHHLVETILIREAGPRCGGPRVTFQRRRAFRRWGLMHWLKASARLSPTMRPQ